MNKFICLALILTLAVSTSAFSLQETLSDNLVVGDSITFAEIVCWIFFWWLDLLASFTGDWFDCMDDFPWFS